MQDIVCNAINNTTLFGGVVSSKLITNQKYDTLVNKVIWCDHSSGERIFCLLYTEHFCNDTFICVGKRCAHYTFACGDMSVLFTLCDPCGVWHLIGAQFHVAMVVHVVCSCTCVTFAHRPPNHHEMSHPYTRQCAVWNSCSDKIGKI